ncbi:MAG: N-ATPase subunit AtpR [Gammaproteobacteria bacterium]
MNDNLMLALAFGAGALLGGFFFGGLWWTVQKGIKSRRPALWFFSSMLLRTAITLAGFYGVAADQWQRFLACLAGFIVVRFIVVRLTRSWPIKSPEPVEE